MSYAYVITLLMAKTLKLLIMFFPLMISAIILFMTFQAYIEITNIDFGGNLETASSSVKFETGRLPQSTGPGR